MDARENDFEKITGYTGYFGVMNLDAFKVWLAWTVTMSTGISRLHLGSFSACQYLTEA